jgi:hypothetical protein
MTHLTIDWDLLVRLALLFGFLTAFGIILDMYLENKMPWRKKKPH